MLAGAQGTRIRVVSLNVNCDGLTQRRKSLRFERRFPRIAEFLEEQDADVIVLNELRDYPSEGVSHVALVERAFSVSYRTCTFSHNCSPSSFHNLVLVHRRLGTVVAQTHLWPTSSTDEGGAALSPTFALVRGACEREGRSVGVCVVELHRASRTPAGGSPEQLKPSGRRLIVAAFHAGVAVNDKRQQYASLALLPSLYPGLPLLLAGDFNVFAEDPPADELFACLRLASFSEVAFDDTPGTFIPYSHEPLYDRVMRLPPRRLDRMFVAGALRLAETSAEQRGGGRPCCLTQPVYMGSCGGAREQCGGDAQYGGEAQCSVYAQCGGVGDDGGGAKKPPSDAHHWKKQFPVDSLASDHFALTAVLEIHDPYLSEARNSRNDDDDAAERRRLGSTAARSNDASDRCLERI